MGSGASWWRREISASAVRPSCTVSFKIRVPCGAIISRCSWCGTSRPVPGSQAGRFPRPDFSPSTGYRREPATERGGGSLRSYSARHSARPGERAKARLRRPLGGLRRWLRRARRDMRRRLLEPSLNDLSLTILPEQAEDDAAIEKLYERTFGPGRFARSAYRLRESVPHRRELSFTARIGTLLVGSVRLTP